jgi:hypothetical protein
MAGRIAKEVGAATSAATNAGVITVASTTDFLAGARAWLTAAGQPNRLVKIKAILSATTMQVQFDFDPLAVSGTATAGGPSYGQSDVSAYAVGRIDQFMQPVWNATDAAAP